jgi:nitrogen fixation-related uncharacterized protein
VATLFKKSSKGPKEQVKQVRLKLRSIEVWSAVKAGFLISIALAIGTLVAAFLLWSVLANSGIFSSLGGLISSVLGDGNSFNLETQFSFDNVMSTALTLSLLNVVLTTALSAVWAVIFNIISKIVGGVAVTFTNN